MLNDKVARRLRTGLVGLGMSILLVGCTQESQNQLGRAIQNWTGTNGILEIYAGGQVVKRFVRIDKLSTAGATSGGSVARPYRFGYGILDKNLNGVADPGEKKVYFEFSDYSTPYVFYEAPE
jgi:hypothetical protein